MVEIGPEKRPLTNALYVRVVKDRLATLLGFVITPLLILSVRLAVKGS
jgi:hypothetical protein